jgi:hypothetical protein
MKIVIMEPIIMPFVNKENAKKSRKPINRIVPNVKQPIPKVLALIGISLDVVAAFSIVFNFSR